jgi:hypothetical protein
MKTVLRTDRKDEYLRRLTQVLREYWVLGIEDGVLYLGYWNWD